MSPFSQFLHDLRMRRRLRQADLADLLGYEQSYISALEVGLRIIRKVLIMPAVSLEERAEPVRRLKRRKKEEKKEEATM